MTKRGYKKPFEVYREVSAGEELVKKEGIDELRLIHFDIYNVGVDVIRLRINESDEVITLNPNEGYQMLEFAVYSCVCEDDGEVQMSGLY